MDRAAHSIERRGCGGGSRGPAGRIVPLLAWAALCGWLLAGCGSGGGLEEKRIDGLRVVDVHQYGVYVEAGGGGRLYVGQSPAGQAELRIGDWFTIVESPERVENYQLMLIDGDVAKFKQQTRIDRRAQREGIQVQHDVIEVRSYEPESESPATSE